jgi:predicted PurR-regulated permease PerM
LLRRRWAGNNVTRPFRIAGAAALAPFMDRVMERLQAKLRLKNKAAAFAILVAAVALLCFSVLGGLFFSRWVRG